MFIKEWRRLRRQYPWQPLGGLLILVLLAGVVLDILWSDYAAVAQRRQQVEMELQAARMKAERLPALEAKSKESAAASGGLQSRLIPPQGDSEASNTFGQLLRGWYEAKGIKQVAVSGVTRHAVGGLVYYRANLDAALRIEQLEDLLQSKPYAPLALRLREASIKTNDDLHPTGLQTTLTWEGLLAPAKPEEPATDPTPTKSAKPTKPATNQAAKGQRTVSRGANTNLTATKTTEEKRK